MRVYVVMEFCQNDESKREEGYLANVDSSRKAAERFIEERRKQELERYYRGEIDKIEPPELHIFEWEVLD